MASRKVNTEGIDESLLLASIGKSKTAVPTPEKQSGKEALPEKEEIRFKGPNAPSQGGGDKSGRKKGSGRYDDVFLARNEIKTRKCVYISREVHRIVLKIVREIAHDGITVGGYIDTVVKRHLEENRDEINRLYKRNRENLI